MKKTSMLILCAAIAGVAGCRRTQKSQVVMLIEGSGGGDVSRSTPDGIAQFLAKHDDVRKQITPLCRQQQDKAPADWTNSDEGKVCAGNTAANFFGKTTVKSDGVKF